MLYIDDIGNNTIRFGNAQGGGSYPKFLSKPLYAESDLLGRVWIKDGYTDINYLNCYDPSQITLEGTVYEVDDFVSEFNIIGSLLNQFDALAPTLLSATAVSDVQLDLAWTVNSTNRDGHRIYISTDNVTFTLKGTVLGATATYNATGLSNYTRYYFKVVAYKSSTESTAATVDAYTLYYAQLEKVGTGAGVVTVRFQVSENQTLTLIGDAKFYTDAAGTANESSTWNVTTGALRTIYVKCPVNSKMKIEKPNKLIRFGSTGPDGGWDNFNDAPRIVADISKFTTLTHLALAGNATFTGAIPSTVVHLNYYTSYISWSGSILPTVLTYLQINSSNINLTLLDFSGTGNISLFTLSKWRSAKMSSDDMVTLLTSLKNRVGSLPATITINDYADYASPPTTVTDAVAALKAAKSITTVNLGA